MAITLDRRIAVLMMAVLVAVRLAAVPSWAVEGAPTVIRSEPQELNANPIFVSRNVTVKVYFLEPMKPDYDQLGHPLHRPGLRVRLQSTGD